MTVIDEITLTWSRDAREVDADVSFGFDPMMGLLDLDGRQIGIESWQLLAAHDEKMTASLTVDPRTTLEEVQQAIARLESEGGFRSVIVEFDMARPTSL